MRHSPSSTVATQFAAHLAHRLEGIHQSRPLALLERELVAYTAHVIAETQRIESEGVPVTIADVLALMQGYEP